VRCRLQRDLAAGSLTDRRSQRTALALGPVDGLHVLGKHQISQSSSRTSTVSSKHADDPAAPRAHRRAIQDQ
jgi:hypothetical protein